MNRSPSIGDEGPDQARLTLTEHLTELRARLLKSLLAVVVTSGLCLAFAEPILTYSVRPLLDVVRDRARLEVMIVASPEVASAFEPVLDTFETVRLRAQVSDLSSARVELERATDADRPIDLVFVSAASIENGRDRVADVLDVLDGFASSLSVAYLLPRDARDEDGCRLSPLDFDGAQVVLLPARRTAIASVLRSAAAAAGKVGSGDKLVVLSPMDPFFAYLKIALVCGLFLACPIWLYQAWRFIAPGLYVSEKRFIVPGVMSASLLFLAGGLFAYYVMFPMMFDVLLNQMMPSAVAGSFTIDKYLTLLLHTMVAFGAVFELPLVMAFLAAAGLVRAETLRRFRKYAIVLAFVVGAILTPPDPLSQVLMAVPLVLFFEIGVLLASVFGRRASSASS
ncbi:MAG: twin-arginine translocase subunit TatC [Deltaproteobacteria bacterium]|nr:twin-arginine translocase subunit TatC [Deltaproteobacteria bacterium]